MFRKKSLAASLVFITAYLVATGAQAGCETANGKITNNIQPGGDTLGVVALNLGGQKLKCAIAGKVQNGDPEGVNYRHTVVCDDKAAPGEAQAQITFKTWFTGQTPTGSCDPQNPYGPVSFAFTEISVPEPGTARGAFSHIDTGWLEVQGDYNCNGGIVMKFYGDLGDLCPAVQE